MRRALAAASLAVLSTVLTAPTAVWASCAGPAGPGGAATLKAQVDAAPTVFVGTVVGTSNNDRVARVHVETVWRGSVLSVVTVSGTPDPNSGATSVDRTFKAGQRYLFVPYSNSSPFQDNSCSATQAYSTQLDSLRPATAQPPAPGSDGLDPTGLAFLPLWIWPAFGGLLIAGGIAGWLLFRSVRRR